MKRFVPLGILALTAAASAAVLIAHVAAGRSPSVAIERLISLGLALATVFWVMVDARARHRTPCYDFGFLVAVFFPASLVWYAVWSRGWKGLLTLFSLAALWFVPWLSATAFWMLRYGLH